MAAAVERIDGRHGASFGRGPATAVARQAVRRELALRLRQTAAHLPAVGAEARLADHLLPFGDVGHRLIGRFPALRALEQGTPLHQPLQAAP